MLATAQRCIDAGKHVHLDKPAGDSLPQYRKLLDAAAKKKLLVQMGYMYRYSPAVVILRQFLREGWLGDVFEVHTVMSKVVGDAERKNLAEFRGGIMFELGCHVIDLVIGVLGKPDRVHAFPRHSGKQNDGLLDNMLAVFEYPQGHGDASNRRPKKSMAARGGISSSAARSGTFHIQPLDSPRHPPDARSRPRANTRKGTHDIALPKFTRYVADAADMAQDSAGGEGERFFVSARFRRATDGAFGERAAGRRLTFLARLFAPLRLCESVIRVRRSHAGRKAQRNHQVSGCHDNVGVLGIIRGSFFRAG